MKARKETSKGRIKLIVSDRSHSLDSESWDFYVDICGKLVEMATMTVLGKYEGPDACRWICTYQATTVYLDFDDMVGTIISLDEHDANAQAVAEKLCSLLESMN